MAAINHFDWLDNGYQPQAQARVGWNKNGFLVLLCAKEPKIDKNEKTTGGAVCRDSCLEFFFQPLPDQDARYANVECNPVPVFHVGIGASRQDRTTLREDIPGINARPLGGEGSWWGVAYILPTAFLTSVFPGFTLTPGARMRGNFFKCNETNSPHFGMWNPTLTEKPDFHRPERFGEMSLGGDVDV